MIYKRDFPFGAAKIGRLFYKSKFYEKRKRAAFILSEGCSFSTQ
jgi:hypothetical protein